jgi:diguanylate cyclase (GGDEF)-like protein/PAS domain S-box-containing protein
MERTRVEVLLLEDTEADRLYVEACLEGDPQVHCTLRHAGTVAALLAAAQERRPDVLLIDLCVPDSQGIATFQRVKAALPDLPIVVQSGVREEAVALQAVREGAQDYLCKGRFDAQHLQRALRYALERHRSELALRVSEQRWALVVDGANDGVWDWDLRAQRVWFSPRWLAMVGCRDGDLGGAPDAWLQRVHPDDLEGLLGAIAAHTSGACDHIEHEHRIGDCQGAWLWVLCRGVAVRGDDGKPSRMAGSMTDITTRKQQEERLLHDAFHDQLTGLPNRALCLDRLGLSLRRAARHPEYQFALLFLDLDRFKVVNDSLGHGAGDQLLRAIGERLSHVVRPADTVARLGGDEFCILVEEMHSPIDAVRVAERAQAALSRPFVIDGQEVFTSASIGIAVRSPQHQQPEDMVRDADLAMYRAKQSGKARHKVSDSGLHVRAVARMELETELRRAIDRHEITLQYQPIIDLHQRKTVGVEALARWQPPGRQAVSPADFIPLAEETGLIVPLGRQVLERALRQLVVWDGERQIGELPLTMAVNLSARQLLEPDLPRHVAATLRALSVEPQRLTLEITESAVIADWDTAAGHLDAITKLGVRVDLDDFGTGFSSLTYLQKLPLHRIKIDRSFVANICAGGSDWEIVKAIVALGRSLSKEVVAEGIETIDQVKWLRKLHCEYGQGYWFARPVHDLATVRKAGQAATSRETAKLWAVKEGAEPA